MTGTQNLYATSWQMRDRASFSTLQSDMGLGSKIDSVRCALMPEQVEDYDLPTDPAALKKTDSRAKKYRKMFGDLAVELDALSPPILQGVVEASILASLDEGVFEEQKRLQEEDRLDEE